MNYIKNKVKHRDHSNPPERPLKTQKSIDRARRLSASSRDNMKKLKKQAPLEYPQDFLNTPPNLHASKQRKQPPSPTTDQAKRAGIGAAMIAGIASAPLFVPSNNMKSNSKTSMPEPFSQPQNLKQWAPVSPPTQKRGRTSRRERHTSKNLELIENNIRAPSPMHQQNGSRRASFVPEQNIPYSHQILRSTVSNPGNPNHLPEQSIKKKRTESNTDTVVSSPKPMKSRGSSKIRLTKSKPEAKPTQVLSKIATAGMAISPTIAMNSSSTQNIGAIQNHGSIRSISAANTPRLQRQQTKYEYNEYSEGKVNDDNVIYRKFIFTIDLCQDHRDMVNTDRKWDSSS